MLSSVSWALLRGSVSGLEEFDDRALLLARQVAADPHVVSDHFPLGVAVARGRTRVVAAAAVLGPELGGAHLVRRGLVARLLVGGGHDGGLLVRRLRGAARERDEGGERESAREGEARRSPGLHGC